MSYLARTVCGGVALLLACCVALRAEKLEKSDEITERPVADAGSGSAAPESPKQAAPESPEQWETRMAGELLNTCGLKKNKEDTARLYWRQAAAWVAHNEPDNSKERTEKRAVAVCPVMRAYELSFDHAVRFINNALRDYHIVRGGEGKSSEELARLVDQSKDPDMRELNVRLYLVKPAMEEIFARSPDSAAARHASRFCYTPKIGQAGQAACLEEAFVDHFLKPRGSKDFYKPAAPGGNVYRLTLAGRDYLLEAQHDKAALPSDDEEQRRLRDGRIP